MQTTWPAQLETAILMRTRPDSLLQRTTIVKCGVNCILYGWYQLSVCRSSVIPTDCGSCQIDLLTANIWVEQILNQLEDTELTFNINLINLLLHGDMVKWRPTSITFRINSPTTWTSSVRTTVDRYRSRHQDLPQQSQLRVNDVTSGLYGTPISQLYRASLKTTLGKGLRSWCCAGGYIAKTCRNSTVFYLCRS